MNPTSSPTDSGVVSYSLSEIQAQCRKAARGAGLAWGLAEEAGKAARWLTSFELPGPRVLAKLLMLNDGKPYETLRPTSIDGIWNASAGELCPLIAGVMLSDIAADIATGHRVEMAAVTFPILLIPFLGQTAEQLGIALQVSWSDVRVVCLPGGISISGNVSALEAHDARHLVCAGGALVDATDRPSAKSRVVDASTWAALEHFARRTYVPASEASRSGAGSTLTDNQ